MDPHNQANFHSEKKSFYESIFYLYVYSKKLKWNIGTSGILSESKFSIGSCLHIEWSLDMCI